jgi:hypothetical protein
LVLDVSMDDNVQIVDKKRSFDDFMREPLAFKAAKTSSAPGIQRTPSRASSSSSRVFGRQAVVKGSSESSKFDREEVLMRLDALETAVRRGDREVAIERIEGIHGLIRQK